MFDDHWDCSVEHLDLISRYALEILGGTTSPPAGKEKEFDMARQAVAADGTVWMINPPFKQEMSDDGLRLDYIARGWIEGPLETVHPWTLDQLVDVSTSGFTTGVQSAIDAAATALSEARAAQVAAEKAAAVAAKIAAETKTLVAELLA